MDMMGAREVAPMMWNAERRAEEGPETQRKTRVLKVQRGGRERRASTTFGHVVQAPSASFGPDLYKKPRIYSLVPRSLILP
jgi:hypothetical protein